MPFEVGGVRQFHTFSRVMKTLGGIGTPCDALKCVVESGKFTLFSYII